MGIILKPSRIIGDKGNDTVEALFDTGAGASFLRKDIAERIGTIVTTPAVLEFSLADGKGTLRVNETVNLNVLVSGLTLFFTFLVVEALGE